MELSPTIMEDYLEHKKKSSLQSWKRILQQSNIVSSTEAHETPSYPLKRPQLDCSQQGSPVFKKLAVECDSKAG